MSRAGTVQKLTKSAMRMMMPDAIYRLATTMVRKPIRAFRVRVLRFKNIITDQHKQFRRHIATKTDLQPFARTFADCEQHIFFGYYDITPFSWDETKFLAMKVATELETPDGTKVAQVGFFDMNSKDATFRPIGTTDTWCWQQGCRLQWYPASSRANEAIFYNKLHEGSYGAVVQSVTSGEILHTIHHPVYDLDASGKWGLSLNFSRLQRLRPGYGYVNLPDDSRENNCPSADGVWLVDIEHDQARLLYSLADLAAESPHQSMANAQHYINHLSFNPTGDSFLFFHRWIDVKGLRHTRLFTSNREGTRLTLLNNTGHVSHYTWRSDEDLVVTTFIAPHQLRYVLYHQTEGFKGIIGNRHLTQDGHPTFINQGRHLITDTKPDEFRDQKLLLLDLERDTLRVIERYYMPSQFTGEVRCDLHPRPSYSEKWLCADIVENGRRAIRILDIRGLAN